MEYLVQLLTAIRFVRLRKHPNALRVGSSANSVQPVNCCWTTNKQLALDADAVGVYERRLEWIITKS